VPESVIERAKELVEELSGADITYRAKNIKTSNYSPPKNPNKSNLAKEPKQLSLFGNDGTDSIVLKLRDLDLGNMTPIDALNTLYHMQETIKKRY